MITFHKTDPITGTITTPIISNRLNNVFDEIVDVSGSSTVTKIFAVSDTTEPNKPTFLTDYDKFCVSIIDSTAQTVGDLTGNEDEYGASRITYIEDDLGNSTTPANIKKLKVEKHQGVILFRVGEPINIREVPYQIYSIVEGVETEITLTSTAPYIALGNFATSILWRDIEIGENPLFLKQTINDDYLHDGSINTNSNLKTRTK